MLENRPGLKKFLLYLINHPYTARPRVWMRWFVIPFIIKRGKGSVIRRKARLDIIPSKKLIVGRRAIIEDYVVINNGMGDVIIGDNSHITPRVTVVGPVKLGNNVILANGVHISGLTHNYEDVDMPVSKQGVSTNPVIIEDDVWIGGNSCINQGVHIGSHSMVGAGSVVTKDIPAYSVAAGNPARLIRQYNFKTKKWERV